MARSHGQRAVQTTNYEGTVVREKDRKLETFEVVHTMTDGVVREKVIFKDGNGLEIIRNGNEVHCIFPRSRVRARRRVERPEHPVLDAAIERHPIR